VLVYQVFWSSDASSPSLSLRLNFHRFVQRMCRLFSLRPIVASTPGDSGARHSNTGLSSPNPDARACL